MPKSRKINDLPESEEERSSEEENELREKIKNIDTIIKNYYKLVQEKSTDIHEIQLSISAEVSEKLSQIFTDYTNDFLEIMDEIKPIAQMNDIDEMKSALNELDEALNIIRQSKETITEDARSKILEIMDTSQGIAQVDNFMMSLLKELEDVQVVIRALKYRN